MPEPCGCRVNKVYLNEVPYKADIAYCPKHLAVEKLIGALKECYCTCDCIEDEDIIDPSGCTKHDALHAAEGKE